jgi:tungstate transport system ATP-binding protein
VSFARAFTLDPEARFLDDPFAAIDAPTRARLIDEPCDVLAESGTAAVLVLHAPPSSSRTLGRAVAHPFLR